MKFHKDVVIDIVCFRKLGHNEQDEPSLTQPLMYKKIAAASGHAQALRRQAGGAGRRARRRSATSMVKAYRAALDAGKHAADPVLDQLQEQVRGRLGAVPRTRSGPTPPTPRVPAGRAEAPGRAHHRRARQTSSCTRRSRRCSTTARAMGRRRGCRSTGAWASTWPTRRWWPSGYPVRLSGQDCGRGTFFAPPRRAARPEPREAGTRAPTCRCRTSPRTRRRFDVIDSMLSEEAVLGFEYGYATADPNTLVIWEAQFGDFANGAQVVIDQFIASGEVQVGPHVRPHAAAAARLRRAGPGALARRASSASCSCAPSTTCRWCVPTDAGADLPHAAPADGAHVAQAADHHDAEDPAAQQGRGLAARRARQAARFQTRDPRETRSSTPTKVKRVVVCSGKVYYDLVEKRARARHRRRRDRARRAALSVPAQGVRGRAEEVPERDRRRVVPGRAAEPGRVVPHPALHPREHARRPEAGLRRPRRLGLAGRGLLAPAPGAAEGAGRRRVRLDAASSKQAALDPTRSCPNKKGNSTC